MAWFVETVYAIKFSLNDYFKELIAASRANGLAPGQTVQLGFWERIAAGDHTGLGMRTVLFGQ